MEIAIQLLGSGSAFAKSFYNTNALVTAGGFTLMIDCGTTAPRSLHELGISLDSIDGIFISHLHADHIGGMEEIAFKSKYPLGIKPKLFIPAVLVEPLWEHSLRGGLENGSEGLNSLQDYFEVTAIDEGVPIELAPGFSIETVPTSHVPGKACHGLLLNGFVFYSGDTRFDRELLERMVYERGVRTILHDCQLQPPGIVHATLEELLTLPEDIQKRISLFHYGDDMASYIGKTGPMPFLEQHNVYRFSPNA